MRNRSVLLSIAVLIALLLPACSFSAVIEGIVLSSSGPVEGPGIYAYKEYHDIKNGSPSHISMPGDKKGFYRLELPPGNYYLTAAGKVDGKDYFSFHGANPIQIAGGKLWIPFMVLPETTATAGGGPSAKLSGIVTFRGKPVTGAHVSIYSPSAPAFRGMGFLTNTTDESGLFRMKPEPGTYVVIARKRMDFGGIRPLKSGDLFCYPSANPVMIRQSGGTFIEIPCYPKNDLKAFLDEEIYPAVLVKKSGEDSIRFRENRIEKTGGTLLIKGRVTDLHGNPMKNLYVKAYKGKPSKMFKMLYLRTMPEFMGVSDEDGRFMIDAVEKGTYYIVARELMGEAPAKGEYYGLYEENADHAVVMDTDSVDGINIVVSRVMGEAQSAKGIWHREKDKKWTMHIKDFKNARDTVIKTDTLWSGEIFIKGTVHVARGATLTIKPGTVIRFKKVDENRDGVGDSRLKVSGRLVAEGTPDNMIRFTSAEKKPDKMDWSYLLFFVSGDENIVKYCNFEYAFTGIQVHFSKASVTDSVFTKNHEAIRFGRTELRIEHNEIFNNTYGIRFTRLEGPVEIKYNNIRNNDVGIFHVPSNQNIVDFSATFSKKGIYHRWQPVVRYNNISYNDEYNYRLGERQGYNILLKDNWWGSSEIEKITELIYDEKKDSTMGRVVFKPFFSAPVESAGVRGGG
ncbi:MAG: NosD domain-containing protein [Nitrospirota bacterium]